MVRTGQEFAGGGPDYRRDIDGLRAIAVSSVVFYHAGLTWLPGGFVGVDVFFVISGYLIGGILLREVGERRFKFTEFYARRARRILPALFAVVLATCAFGLVFLSSTELQALGTSAASALAGVANIRFWLSTGYFTPDAHFDPMLMTWSLGVEEQFYVVFPFLLLALARLTPRARMIALACLTLASFALAQIMIGLGPTGAFYLLPARAWELAVGALLACVHLEGKGLGLSGLSQPSRWRIEAQGAIGVALIAVSIATFNEHTPVPGWPMLAPVMGSALLLASPSSFVNRILLSARPMVFIGLVSYSWYLWHWPLMAFARIASLETPPLSATLTLAVISFLLAIVSWRWIERPFRRRSLPAPALLVRYAAAGVLVAAAPIVLRASGGWSERLPTATRAMEDAIVEGRGTACLLDYGVTDILRTQTCLPGPTGKPAIALLGDSHAAALSAGLSALASDHDLRLLSYVKSICPPLLGVTVREDAHPQHVSECARYFRSVVEEVAADPDIKLVVLAAYWSFGPWVTADGSSQLEAEVALKRGLTATLDALSAAGKEIVVVGDVPGYRFDLPRYAMGLSLPLRHDAMKVLIDFSSLTDETIGADHMLSDVSVRNTLIREVASGRSDAAYLDLDAQFCTPGWCRFSQAGDLWYFDGHHLTTRGSLHALDALRRRLATVAQPLAAKAWAG